MSSRFLEADFVVLCGGQGTRFKEVSPDLPKVLTKIGNITYLEYILKKCIHYKIETVTLAMGHLHHKIINFLKKKKFDIKINLSIENEILGTWGAVINAKNYINKDYFYIINGDTFNDLNLSLGLKYHVKNNFEALLFGLKVKKFFNLDYGYISSDKNYLVNSFSEKTISKNNILFQNSGIYLFDKSLIKTFEKQKKSSLEKDILPKIVAKKVIGIYDEDVNFFDFGTYERFNLINKNYDISQWI